MEQADVATEVVGNLFTLVCLTLALSGWPSGGVDTLPMGD